MIFGYANSNNELSLFKQVVTLLLNGCNTVYEEPQHPLTKVISRLTKGDTFVITSMNVIAKSVVQALRIINDLVQKGVVVYILDIGLINEEQTVTRNLLNAIENFNQESVEAPTEPTIKNKKIVEIPKEGRPEKYTNEQIEQALSLLRCNGGSLSYNAVARATGISKSTLIRKNKDKPKIKK